MVGGVVAPAGVVTAGVLLLAGLALDPHAAALTPSITTQVIGAIRWMAFLANETLTRVISTPHLFSLGTAPESVVGSTRSKCLSACGGCAD